MFDAFISYSHAADGKLGPALQAAMHRFGKPWYRLRAVRVFRDQTSLSTTPHLWKSIETALAEARYFILLASPDAAASAWVSKEIAYWLEHKSPESLLIVLTDGEIAWDAALNDFAWPASTALPNTLSRAFTAEPRFSDMRSAKRAGDLSMRNPQFLEVVAELSAAVRGLSKDELVGEDVRQHAMTRRLEWAVGASLLTLALLAGAYAVDAGRQRDTALAHGLAARAEVLLGQRGILMETATLLAVEGMRRMPGVASPPWWQRPLVLLPQLLRPTRLERQAEEVDADAALRKALEILPRRLVDIPCAAEGEVGKARFSPDGRFLATVVEEAAVHVWETESGALLARLETGPIRDLAFEPNAEHLLVLGGGRAQVWDLTSRTIFSELPGDKIDTAVYDSTGSYLLTAGSDLKITRWNTVSYQADAEYVASTVPRFLAVSAGAQELIAWSDDADAEVFRFPGPSVLRLPRAALVRRDFRYSPDGRYLVESLPTAYSLGLYDRVSRQELLFEERHWAFDFSPDGAHLALGSPEWDAYVYDLSTCSRAGVSWRPSRGGTMSKHYVEGRSSCARFDTVRHDNSIEMGGVWLSTGGRLMATLGRDGTARVWESSRGREVLRLLEAVEGDIRELAFSADGTRITGVGPKLCRTWQSTGHPAALAVQREDAIISVAFSSGGDRIATASMRSLRSPGIIDVWSFADGHSLVHTLGPGQVSLSPDGRLLAIDGRHVFRVDDRAKVGELAYPEDATASVLSTNWRVVVHGLRSGELVVADRESGSEYARLPAPEGEGTHFAVNATGCCVASASSTGAIQVRNWEAEPEARRLRVEGPIHRVSLDGPGRRLALITGADKTSVEILEVGSGKRLAKLEHEGEVTDTDFSPDGQYLITGSTDKTARVWHLERGGVIAQLPHDADVTRVTFSPDGKYAVSAGGRSDRTLRIWLWRPADLIAEACARVSRNLSAEEWGRYVGDEPYRETCPLKASQE